MCIDQKYDFRPLGLAIKRARMEQGMTRKKLAEIVDVDGRYLTNVENIGQQPSLRVFYKLVTLFHISVDQYFYPEIEPQKSTLDRQIDIMLEKLTDKDKQFVAKMVKAVLEAKEAEKG